MVKGEPGFTVTAGSCTVTSGGSCFQSVNYPSNYGDNEQCSIRVDGTVNNEKLYSGFFLTENCCDKLTINGTQYKGSNGPSGVTVATNQVITWSTDGSVTRQGFRICFKTECTNTQGQIINNAICGCGTALCSVGDYCTASLDLCHGPPCDFTDGSAINTKNNCKCGNVKCSNDTGLICYSSFGGGACRESNLGNFGYPRVYTSNCNVGIDQHKIKDEAACSIAGLDLGLADTTVSRTTSQYSPLGCYTSKYGLTFNSASSSMVSCSDAGSDADFCICISTSACNNTDGTEENLESCTCGSSLCRPDDGLFCTSSISLCAGPPCTTTNGSAINQEPCKCGNEACTASTGLICFSEVGGGSCRKQDVGAFGYNRLRSGHCIGSGLSGRTIINNVNRCQTAANSMHLTRNPNKKHLQKINTVYPSTSRPPGCYLKDTGEVYFNSVLSSTASCSSSATFCICLSMQNCVHTDGLIRNDALCTCGTSVCDQSLYCTAILNSCHEQTCSIVDGSALSVLPTIKGVTSISCQCGQESCTGSGLICFATVGSGSCRVQDPGNYGFNRMYTGRCLDPSVAGRNLIQDQALCEEAATSIGLTDQKATVVTSLDDPPGCSFSSDGLVFNSYYSSPASCSTSSDYCICISAPVCNNINGLFLNPGKAQFD